MSLLSSFTAPKWQHKDPDVRKEGISQLDDEAILLALVTGDPDPDVRAAALSRITRPDVLDNLIESLAQPLQSRAREQRLRQILPDPGELHTIHDDERLIQIAGLANDEDLVTAAIRRITDEAALARLAGSHPQARVRMAAAQNIDSLDVLGVLMQQSRGRDKSLYRHCKAILDQHHTQQQTEAERQAQIAQLLDRASQLERCASLAEFDSLHRLVSHPLEKLRSALSEEQTQVFARHFTTGAHHRAQLLQRRESEEQAQSAALAAAATREALLIELATLVSDRPPPETNAAIDQHLAELQALDSRWEATSAEARPDLAVEGDYRRLLAAERDCLQAARQLLGSLPKLEKLLREAQAADLADYDSLHKQQEKTRQFLSRLVVPEKLAGAVRDRIHQLRQVDSELSDALEALRQGQVKRSKHILDTIAALQAALDQNHIKQADRSLTRARNDLRSLPPGAREQFEHELRPLAARLNDMHDWQGFAIEPKKVELCARMEALMDSGLDPDSLAARIKALQEEWRLLGALTHAREQALWLQFKAAADRAWQPCQQAFDQRAEVQRQNYARRMQIVTQLREYEQKMSWPDTAPEPAEDSPMAGGIAPDWRMVQKTLDTARTAFRAIQPLTAKGDQKSHLAFQAVCDRIYAHIKAEYGRNIALKEALVEQAGQLATMADLPQAIDQAKQLQTHWKQVGITPVAIDRKLWKSFRSACDAVFARLGEQRCQLQAELHAHLKQAEDLAQQARALMQADDEKVPVLGKMLSELKQQLDQIELPQAVRQRLNGEFQTLQREATRLAGDLRQRQQGQSWQRLRSIIMLCAASQAAPDRTGEAPLDNKDLPRGLDTRLLETFWREGATAGQDDALRQACIALEVLAGVESPVGDKQARMAYQMQRLARGMGAPDIDPAQALLDCIHAFVTLRPSADWATRFCATLKGMKG